MALRVSLRWQAQADLTWRGEGRISLAEARRGRDDARKLVADGIDPSAAAGSEPVS
ncbi:MAG: integrase arm-type DNA-binding domain-containing protein [Myxococcales bacterium]